MFCRHCGKEVAEQAVSCGSCGCPPKSGTKFCNTCAAETNDPKTEICMKCGVRLATVVTTKKGGMSTPVKVVIGVFIALVVVRVVTSEKEPSGTAATDGKASGTNTLSYSTKRDVESWAERYVTERLKSPYTAKFPDTESSGWRFVKNGETYFVSSYVDSQNSFGAMIRTDFDLKVHLDGKNTTISDFHFYKK